MDQHETETNLPSNSIRNKLVCTAKDCWPMLALMILTIAAIAVYLTD